jgi:hypothetical protein
MEEVTATCLAGLTDKRLNRLFLILQSTKYLDRMVASMEQQDSHLAKLQGMLVSMDTKKEEMSALIAKSAPLLQQIAASTKVVQRQTEAALSKEYSGREVHIIGEINSL